MRISKFGWGLVAVAIIYTGILVGVNRFKNQESAKVDEVLITSEWTHYKNDVLGVEFDYPKSWGKVILGPATTLTNLKSVNRDFVNSLSNDYRYMVKIAFNQNIYVSFDFINDQYPGFESNYAPQMVLDNFVDLIKVRDICKYELKDKLVEQYDVNCRNGVKTMAMKYLFDNRDCDNYEVRAVAYKRLQNGCFDNLFITYKLGFAQSHDKNKRMTTEEILSQRSKEERNQQTSIKSEMEQIVKSIKVYPPKKVGAEEWKEIANEDSNIRTIRQYYFWLSNRNLTKAYEMMKEAKVSEEEYKKWYENVILAKARDFKSLGGGKYQFMVDYQEENSEPVKYLVTMEVSGRKVKTLISEKLLSEVVTKGEMSAVVKERNGENYLVLIKNGIEKVLIKEKGNYDKENDDVNFTAYRNPEFSPMGKYLMITGIGWEWYFKRIFNTTTLKEVNIRLLSVNTLEFNNDESQLLICSQNEFAGDFYAELYQMPQAKKIRDVVKESGIDANGGVDVECSFDKDSQVAKVKFTKWSDRQNLNEKIIPTIIEFKMD